MESFYISLEYQDFIVHVKQDGKYKAGFVYPVEIDSEQNYYYLSQKNGYPQKHIEDSRCFFTFLFCWRGVWEGRIYFKDDEYWISELETINELWKEIEIKLKAQIKKDNPNYTYD